MDQSLDQPLDQSLSPPSLLPAIEQQHVHTVYDRIAPHFSHTKLKAWPRVKRFLLEQEPGALIADIGCGNGKYLHINSSAFKVGSDRCGAFVDIASRPGGHAPPGGRDVMVCDNLRLPYRDRCFDAAISIGVLHHLATAQRRVRALRELARILTPGGRVMIYVWAMEQTKRKFSAQDVLIPWHSPLDSCKKKEKRSKKMLAKERSRLFVSSNSTSDEDSQHKPSRHAGRRSKLSKHIKSGNKGVRSSKNKSTTCSPEKHLEGNFTINKENFKVTQVCNSLLTFLGEWSPFSSSDSDLNSSTEALPAKVHSENHHQPMEFTNNHHSSSRSKGNQISAKRSGSPLTIEAIASKFDLFRAIISSKFSKSTDGDNSSEGSFIGPENWNNSNGINTKKYTTKNGKKLKKIASSDDNVEISSKRIHSRCNSLPILSDQDLNHYPNMFPLAKGESSHNLYRSDSKLEYSSGSCVSTDDEGVSGEYSAVNYEEESRIANMVHQTCLQFDAEILSQYRTDCHPETHSPLMMKSGNKQKDDIEELKMVVDSLDSSKITNEDITMNSSQSPNGISTNSKIIHEDITKNSGQSPNGISTNGKEDLNATKSTNNHVLNNCHHSDLTNKHNGIIPDKLIFANSNQNGHSLLMPNGGAKDSISDATMCKRYYHVFREGELAELIESNVENLNILHSYYDHGNWCIIAEKVNVWKI